MLIYNNLTYFGITQNSGNPFILFSSHKKRKKDISARKSVARNVIKHLRDQRETKLPSTVAVVSAFFFQTNDRVTQFFLPTKDKLIRTAALCLSTKTKLIVTFSDHYLVCFKPV